MATYDQTIYWLNRLLPVVQMRSTLLFKKIEQFWLIVLLCQTDSKVAADICNYLEPLLEKEGAGWVRWEGRGGHLS